MVEIIFAHLVGIVGIIFGAYMVATLYGKQNKDK